MRELTIVSLTARIMLSLVIGGLLGLERGRKNRPAGFRTYILVCLGAALVMMTNQYVYQYFGVSDPVRLGAQVVSGIGFLGAGTIIVTGKNQIKGITTAAGLWTAACCGLAIGIGFYEGAILAGIAIFFVMSLLQKLDERIRRQSRILDAYLELEAGTPFSEVLAWLRGHGVEVSDVQVTKNKVDKEHPLNALVTLHCGRGMTREGMASVLHDAPGVYFVEELG